MHNVASEIEEVISIPLLHIADATAERLKYDRITKVGLLGTAFTMEQSFYKGRLEQKYDIEVVVPSQEQRALVHNVIYSELVKGKVSDTSRQRYLTIIESLRNNGAQAIILGCTEIAMLVEQKYTDVPLYDTTQIHSEAAVDFALSK
jgi:aspartate racemase